MAENEMMTKAELVPKIQQGWDSFNAYLKTLTMEQLMGPTDAAGWTAKDHVMHLAVWEDGINALFEGESRPGQMGVDAETWGTGDFDKINDVIQKRHKDKSWDEVLGALHQAHERLMAKIQTLSDEDLTRPYSYYQPHSTRETPVIEFVKGDTYEHYEQHRPWIEAIIAG